MDDDDENIRKDLNNVDADLLLESRGQPPKKPNGDMILRVPAANSV